MAGRYRPTSNTSGAFVATNFGILSPKRPCQASVLSARRVRRVIDDRARPLGMGAVRATVVRTVRLDAMPDDLAAAVLAHRRQLVNRTLEAVERMCPSGADYLERH